MLPAGKWGVKAAGSDEPNSAKAEVQVELLRAGGLATRKPRSTGQNQLES